MRSGQIYCYFTGWPRQCIIGISFLFLACQNQPEELLLPETVDFNFHIRPILSNNCFLCHGPDGSSREADLRLDLEETATARREDGIRPIVPGSARRSELIKRINSADGDYRMPPPETNKILTAREKALLKKWIDDGAEWKEYWAFIPPSESKIEGDAGHPIDNFINQKIDENRLATSEDADAGTLVRRLSYLLTGLPPDPMLVKKYTDLADDRYLELVDTFLSQPQFGERWARHWMDLMRYAEGRGHEFDYPILGAWRYRDYLIRAFNSDVPYDLLVREHLAGDMMQEPRRNPQEGFNESVLGTGFFPMGEGKHSPVDSKEEEATRIDNIIDVTTKTFQGMTVACARCHDHKFDPIPTTDYYSLYGIFESTRFHNVSVGQTMELQASVDSVDQLKNQIRQFVDRKLSDDQGVKGTPVSNAETETMEDSSLIPIGDFTETLGDWFSDGLAFGNATSYEVNLASNQSALLVEENGKASSLQYGTSVLGALRSPTFILDKPVVNRACCWQQIYDPDYIGQPSTSAKSYSWRTTADYR